MTYRRLIAIDPSLTCSGWAMFRIQNQSLVGVGKLKALPPSHALSTRLRQLQTRIFELFCKLELGAADILVCEAPTTMRDPRAAFKVEQVRAMFEVLARSHGACVPGRINPRSVQQHVMGLSGKQLQRTIVKQTALATARTIYGTALSDLGFNVELSREQDVVDALLLGSLALSWVSQSKQKEISLEEYFDRRPSRKSMRISRKLLAA